MADPATDRALMTELLEGAEAMALLAEQEETFRAAVDAFRALDGESMQLLLSRHGLAERCEVVCHWLRSKECVLLCLELCGPPRLEEEPPDVREFAEVVAKVTGDEELVELLAAAIEQRDADSWRELVEKQGLQRFCHLLCHWACTVHYRLVCDVVCRPRVAQHPHLIAELQAAGQTIGRLAADEKTFAAAVDAVRVNECERLGSTLEDAGFAPFCHFVCEFFCSWRCILVCLRLCRVFPIQRPESPIAEMLEFARAGGKLAAQQGALQRLGGAVLREDVDTVQSLVKELAFERFCIQFCHWVCFLRCQLFCFCVCPPSTIAVFTKIGNLYYDTDVNSHAGDSGLTVADQRAFYSTLRLNGGISVVNGAPLVEYRFQTVPTSADGTTLPDGTPILASSWVAVVSSQIDQTNIGSFIRSIPVPPFLEVIQVWVNRTGPDIFTITPNADGWIQVPPMFPVAPMVPPTPGWRFVPGADLIQLRSSTLTPFVASVDETGVVAGNTANAPLQTDVAFGIRMRMRNQGATGDGTNAGTCNHIAINNTLYDNILHHPYWPGGTFGGLPGSNELAVASIGIDELAAAPCSELVDTMTVKFTAAHSNLGGVTVRLEGPGGPYAFDLTPTAPQVAGESWFGTATPAVSGSPPVPEWNFGDLAPCAYLLKLAVSVLLTTGDPGGNPGPVEDYIAFCKGASD